MSMFLNESETSLCSPVSVFWSVSSLLCRRSVIMLGTFVFFYILLIWGLATKMKAIILKGPAQNKNENLYFLAAAQTKRMQRWPPLDQ